MFSRIINYFRNNLAVEPDLWKVPSMQDRPMSLGFIANTHIGSNKELPRKGDVIIRLESCSMGMTVRKDTRHRVLGIKPATVHGAGNWKYYWAIVENENGEEDRILTAELRRMTDQPRTWVGVF